MLFIRFATLTLTLMATSIAPRTNHRAKSIVVVFKADARCTGSANCRACSTCEYCAHCSGGSGSCGVCSDVSNNYNHPTYTAPTHSSSSAKLSSLPSAKYNFQSSSTSAAITIGEQLNVRSGPSTSYKIIAHLSSSQIVTVLKHSGNWVKISFSEFVFVSDSKFYSKEIAGWVSAQLIRKL